VSIKTDRYAAVAGAIVYSDNDAHGAYFVDNADGDGNATWTARVSDVAPFGEAQVVVSAGHRSGPPGDRETSGDGRSARSSTKVEVRESCP
jgi:hypothetical protein